MISSPAKNTNPNCAETFASLRLYGDDLVPGEISRLLQLEPADSATKNLETISSSGKSRRAPTGRWIFQTRGRVESNNLELHIDWILDQIQTLGGKLDTLPGVEKADIFCYWCSATGHGGPQFSPELMDRLAKNGLTLGLDLYFT